jgi:hypothetical protein
MRLVLSPGAWPERRPQSRYEYARAHRWARWYSLMCVTPLRWRDVQRLWRAA